MAGTALTTREVAKLLSVSEATIKRWASDDLIQSEKTVGGHRRFSLAEIARFQRERGVAPIPRSSAQTANKSQVRDGISPAALFQRLAEGNAEETGALLISAYLNGQSLTSLFDELVTPAMHQIGDFWYRGEMTIADEHLASQTAISALQKLRSVIHQPAPTQTRSLLCGVDGDLHELPIHLVHALLEAEGWDVTDDKRRPLRTLAHFNQQLWLALRGVAGSLPFQPEDTRPDAWATSLAADAQRFRKR